MGDDDVVFLFKEDPYGHIVIPDDPPENNIECKVCLLTKSSKDFSSLVCAHSFCNECFQEIITYTTKCPCCRSFI